MDKEKGYLPTSLADTDVSEDHHRLTYFDKVTHVSRLPQALYLSFLGLYVTLIAFETLIFGLQVAILKSSNAFDNETLYLYCASLMVSFFSLLACVMAKSATLEGNRCRLAVCILIWIADLLLITMVFTEFSAGLTIVHAVINCWVLAYSIKKLFTRKLMPTDTRRFSLESIELDTIHP